MLLELFHFFSPLFPSMLHPLTLLYSTPLSSCPWIVHISSLASPFPILFLTSPTSILCLPIMLLIPYTFPPFFPYPTELITFDMISISLILFLF